MAQLLAGVLPIILFAWASPAAADDPRIQRAVAPAWVDWLAMPAMNPDRVRTAEDGVYDLLYDTQVRIVEAQDATFRRRMIKVLDRAGLEGAAQTQVDFDPSFEKLVINRAAIWRDGRMIDQTATATIDILRRERELDDGIVTGRRTAIVRLDDVRVGDVVDIAWIWQSVSSPWPGDYFSQPDMGWSVPMALTRFRLIAPAGKPLAIRQAHGVPPPMVRRVDGLIEREWRVLDQAPAPYVRQTPAWWHGWPYLDISTMRTWAMVAASGLKQFKGEQALPAGYAGRVDAIAAASADPARRAIAALRLVQDSIRYTSLSVGLGGFVPRSPAEVVRSGFGDCKDKSQLLAVTLRRLGIDAWPALTDIDEGPGLARRLPSAAAFDHVIVLARIGGRDHWFDATASHQGGTLSTLAALPYGYALPLRPGQAGLVAIPNPAPRDPSMASIETYRRPRGALTLQVETTFSGDEADIKRSELATSGVAKVERGYLDYYRAMYPGLVSVAQLGVVDDRDANRLVLRESYRLPDTAKDFAKTIANLQVAASSMRSRYKGIDDAAGRRAPIALPWTIKRTHRIVFDMPGYVIDLPRLQFSNGPAFDLEARTRHEGSRAIMDFVLTGKAMLLPASAAGDYARQLTELDDATNWRIDTTTAGFAPLDASWIGLGFALLVIIGFLVLAMMRRRHSGGRPRSDPETQVVIRHVPITRRHG